MVMALVLQPMIFLSGAIFPLDRSARLARGALPPEPGDVRRRRDPPVVLPAAAAAHDPRLGRAAVGGRGDHARLRRRDAHVAVQLFGKTE